MNVIGAGALGMSAAWALSEEGHDVVLYEQSQPFAESSAKAAGICSTMTWCDDDYDLVATTRSLVGELISLHYGTLRSKLAWRPYDSIFIAKRDGLDDIQDRLERHTEEPERMDYRQAKSEYPQLDFAPGEEILVAQEDGVMDPADVHDLLAHALDVEIRREQVSPEQLEGPTVVATGSWTRQLVPTIPIRNFRTQAASVAIDGAMEMPIVHDAVHGWYSRPESEGSMIAGDGTILTHHEPEDYNQAGDPAFHESIAKRVVTRMRDGHEAHIRNSWAGLCVGTPDRRPLVGPVGDDLYVLTGDNGFGLMRCLALGERLADAVRGKVHPETDPRRFDGDFEFEMQEGYNQ